MIPYYQSCHRFLVLLLILLTVIWLGSDTPPTLAQASPAQPSSLSLADLPADDQHTILSQIQAADYHITPHQTETDQPAFQTLNRVNGLALHFDPKGLSAHSQTNPASWEWQLHLLGYGNSTSIDPVTGQPTLSSQQEQLEYHHTTASQVPVLEWYQNRPTGLKHGFTLLQPPATGPDSTGQITLALSLSTPLQVALHSGSQALHFTDATGQTVLKYDNLHVFDATGHPLPAHFSLTPPIAKGQPYGLRLHLNATGATYPLTVDPLLTNQVAKLTASDGAAEDWFGLAVSISGDTLVVGALLDDDKGDDSGSAYIFTRNQDGPDNWGFVKKLIVNDGAEDDRFGQDVAISGDTVVVGAVGDDAYTGSAYVFERNQDGIDKWGLVKKLVADNRAVNDEFGIAVDISDDIIIIGAVGDNDFTGAAYVFERNQDGIDKWGLVKKLTAIDKATGNSFGWSVAIDNDTLVIGEPGGNNNSVISGAAYVFERNQGGADEWGQVKKLIADDGAAWDAFGITVAISNDTLVIGATEDGPKIGSAYVFERNQGGADEWGQIKKLVANDGTDNDQFGIGVAISSDTIVVGADGDDSSSGSAYIFERNQGGADKWGQVTKLTASNRSVGEFFGISAAISGNTLVIGAVGNDDNGDFSGAAYTFQRSGNNWQQLAKPTANDGAPGDEFGWSVGISGGTLVVGADADDDNGNFSGSAYVFTRNQDGADSWGQLKKLTADDGTEGDAFGVAVGISGDTIVVGASRHNSYIGAAYIFTRNKGGTDNWGQVKKLTVDDGVINDEFGWSVGISGDTIVIGAYGDDNYTGSAYVFERNQDGADKWGQVKKLTATDAAVDDTFGSSVGISGDTIVVGVSQYDSPGSAYVFERNQGGPDNWGQVKKLTVNNGVGIIHFGFAVAISGDTVVVGAYGDQNSSGSAYIFKRNQDGIDKWGQVKELIPNDAANGDQFGIAVGISGDTIAVGSVLDDDNGDASGSVYIFERNQDGVDNWGQVQKLTPNDAAANDHFGRVLDIDGNNVAIGASWDDITYTSFHSAYVFGLINISPEITVLGNGQAIADGSTTSSPANHTDFGSVSPGSTITRTFTISNSGSVALNLTGSPAVTLTAATAFSVITQPVSTTLTTNSSTPSTITFTPPNPGLFTDTVTIANNATDKNPYTFVISGTGLAPDLALAKSVTPATATPGQTITYTLAFSNAGLGSASSVIITDVMPISITTIGINNSGVVITRSGSTFEVQPLSAGQGGVITLTAQISPSLSAGVVTNTAQIGSSTPEISISNNSDSAGVTVVIPTVTLSLSGSPIVEAGGVATITATLSTAAALPVTVTLGYSGTATHVDDYTRSDSQIVIPAGKLAGTVIITAVQDTLDELNETVVVEITAVSNALESDSQQVTATIIDDDGKRDSIYLPVIVTP